MRANKKSWAGTSLYVDPILVITNQIIWESNIIQKQSHECISYTTNASYCGGGNLDMTKFEVKEDKYREVWSNNYDL